MSCCESNRFLWSSKSVLILSGSYTHVIGSCWSTNSWLLTILNSSGLKCVWTAVEIQTHLSFRNTQHLVKCYTNEFLLAYSCARMRFSCKIIGMRLPCCCRWLWATCLLILLFKSCNCCLLKKTQKKCCKPTNTHKRNPN